MSDPSKTAIFVLGMHRSGTSALTRVLNLLGAALPDDLLEANAYNPKGYWEPKSIIEINDGLLDKLHASWDGPFLPETAFGEGLGEDDLALASDTLSNSYAGHGDVIVIKDPRCTLMAPFWFKAARRAGYEPKAVGIYRDFSAVAHSLHTRDGFEPQEVALLWSYYALRCLQALSRQNAPLVCYEDLTGDWTTSLEVVTDYLGSDGLVHSPQAKKKIATFLNPARANEPLELPADLRGVVQAVGKAYKAYMASGMLDDLGQLESQLVKQGDLLRLSGVRHHRLERNRTKQLVADLSKARNDLVETERRLTAERDKARSDLKETEGRITQELEAAQNALNETEKRLIKERDGARAALKDAESRHTADIEAARQALRDTKVRLSQERDEAREAFANLETAVAAYRDRTEELEVERDDARTAFGRAENERLELQMQRDELARRMHALETSTFWRLSAPLRKLLEHMPWATRALRRTVKLSYWTVTGQLSAKLNARREAIEAAQRAGVPGAMPSDRVDEAGSQRLRDFLEAEYSRDTADHIDGLMAHYGLEFQSDGQPPIKTEIGNAQARDWAKRLAGLAPKAAKTPVVSIIIPAYNQIAYTLACIESVFVFKPETPFEILVGDDVSSDGTVEAAKVDIPGVGWVRHEANQGFVGNCNLTAEAARGRIVVFLNNDTLVLPGWLDALVATLDRDDTVGLAGSKLVYPDGRLQEAGGIFWQDGSAWNLGRFDDPRRPELSYAREADYISGASIALPKALWDKLGGFDELYRPAYAEDADLAFRVRDEGLKTIYQPRSALLHFEGVTSGTDLSSGAKAYQVTNLEKLKQRWSEVLADHRPNGLEPQLEKERAVRQRALFVDITTPEPQHDAGSVVAVEAMRALQGLGYKVSFVPQDNFLWTHAFTAPLQAMGIEAIYHPFYSRFEDFISARGHEFDLIIVHRFGAAERVVNELRRHAPQAKIAFLPADLHFLREIREAELADDAGLEKSALATKKRELAVIEQTDAVLTHSTVEQDLLAKETPNIPVYHLPLIHDPEPTPRGFSMRKGVGFIGGYGHPPNIDGVDWFVEAIWPLVRAQLPDARFVLAGSKMPDRFKALDGQDGIEVAGFVPSLPDFFDQLVVSVAPLRFGAGAKGKVAASLAYGTPCVTTPIGAEGMGLKAGKHIEIVKSPRGIANKLVKLLSDEAHWDKIRQGGLDFADSMTSRRVVRERIETMLAGFDEKDGSSRRSE